MSENMTPSDAKVIREQCRAYAAEHVAELSAELLEWHDTSILCDGKVRELARMCSEFVDKSDALPVAKSMVERAAMMVATNHKPYSNENDPDVAWTSQSGFRIAKLEAQLAETREQRNRVVETLTKELNEYRERETRIKGILGILEPLARRTLWIAFVWNDHNFDAAHKYALETAKKYDIHNFNEANDFLDKCDAIISSKKDGKE